MTILAGNLHKSYASTCLAAEMARQGKTVFRFSEQNVRQDKVTGFSGLNLSTSEKLETFNKVGIASSRDLDILHLRDLDTSSMVTIVCENGSCGF